MGLNLTHLAEIIGHMLGFTQFTGSESTEYILQ